jgi:hypothetical protein
MRAYLFDQQTYIKDITVKLTGNDSFGKVVNPDHLDKINSLQIEGIEGKYRVPKRDLGLAWTNRKVQRCPRPVAMTKVIASIRFELETMKILRLEDHVENLVTATNCSLVEVTEELLLELKASDLNFQKAEAVQNTLRYPDISLFYRDNKVDQRKYFYFDPTQPIRMSGVNGLHIYGGILRVARIEEICALAKKEGRISKEALIELTKIIEHGEKFLTGELTRLEREIKIAVNIELLDYYFAQVLKCGFEKYCNLFESKGDIILNDILNPWRKQYKWGVQSELASRFSRLGEQIFTLMKPNPTRELVNTNEESAAAGSFNFKR